MDDGFANGSRSVIKNVADIAYTMYDDLLQADVSREIARMVLPINYYTQWYWKVDLHNLFNFLSLRADPHAQWEIRTYAEKMLEIVKLWCPLAHDAFVEHRLNARTFSATTVKLLQGLLADRLDLLDASARNHGMLERELNDLMTALQS